MAGGEQPWRDLGVRVASGLVLAPAGLACIWAGGAVWTAVLAAISAGMGVEWAFLRGVRLWSVAGAAVPVALLLAGLGDALLPVGLSFGALLLLAIAAASVSVRKDTGLGVLYIGLAYLSLLTLRRGSSGLAEILFIMLTVWAGDIGAYLAGRLIGGPRLAPILSPGKTWSGAAGGLACAVLAGAAVGTALSSAPRPGLYAVVAALLGVAAQAGDLLESAIKRHYGRKDSGSLIPGHGGLLDRLDGVLAASPAALALCLSSGHGATGQGLCLWQ